MMKKKRSDEDINICNLILNHLEKTDLGLADFHPDPEDNFDII